MQQEQLKNVTALMNSFAKLNDTINEQLVEILKLKSLIATRSDSGRRMRRNLDQVKFIILLYFYYKFFRLKLKKKLTIWNDAQRQ